MLFDLTIHYKASQHCAGTDVSDIVDLKSIYSTIVVYSNIGLTDDI